MRPRDLIYTFLAVGAVYASGVEQPTTDELVKWVKSEGTKVRNRHFPGPASRMTVSDTTKSGEEKQYDSRVEWIGRKHHVHNVLVYAVAGNDSGWVYATENKGFTPLDEVADGGWKARVHLKDGGMSRREPLSPDQTQVVYDAVKAVAGGVQPTSNTVIKLDEMLDRDRSSE